MMGKSTYVHKAAVLKMDRIVELLVEPMSCEDIAAKIFCHFQTASRYLWHMARMPKPRRIYVYKWVEDKKTGRKMPLFMAGNESNKRKPPRLTSAEIYKRIQADPLRYAKRKEKYRADWHVKKGRPAPAHRVASPFAVLGM